MGWRNPPKIEDACCRRARQDHEAYVCKRLTAWLDACPRKPADIAFTAGPVRNLARKIEDKLREER